MAEPVWVAILAALDRRTPAFRRGFLAAVTEARGATASRAVRAAMRRGDYQSALTALDEAWVGASTQWQPLVSQQIHEALGAGGTLAAEQVSASGMRMGFNVVNPNAVAKARSLTLDLVTRVNAQQKAAMRVVLGDAVQAGWGMEKTARQLRQMELAIGLDARRAAALSRYTRDVFERLPGRFVRQDRLVEKYAAKLLRQRTQTIASTELARAMTAGQLDAWRQGIASGVLPNDRGKQWVATPDDVWCDYCRGLHHVVVPLQGLFVSPVGAVQGPPLHPNCRCVVRLAKRPAGLARRPVGRRSGTGAGVPPPRRAAAPAARPAAPVVRAAVEAPLMTAGETRAWYQTGDSANYVRRYLRGNPLPSDPSLEARVRFAVSSLDEQIAKAGPSGLGSVYDVVPLRKLEKVKPGGLLETTDYRVVSPHPMGRVRSLLGEGAETPPAGSEIIKIRPMQRPMLELDLPPALRGLVKDPEWTYLIPRNTRLLYVGKEDGMRVFRALAPEESAVLTAKERYAVQALKREAASVDDVMAQLGMGRAPRGPGRWAREAQEAEEAAKRAAASKKATKIKPAAPKRIELEEVFGRAAGDPDPVTASQWRKHWGRQSSVPPPEEFAKAMLTDLEEVGGAHQTTWVVRYEIQGYGDRAFSMEAIARNPEWERSVIVERTFRRLPDGRLLVEHDLFRVPNALQDTGIGRAVLGRQFAFYDAIGVGRVEVHANIDIGGYTWARMGFLPRQQSLPRLAEKIRARWDKLTKAYFDEAVEMDLGPEAVEAVEQTIKELADGDATALWRLSDLTDEVKWAGTVDAKGVASSAGHDHVARLVFNDPQHQTLKLGQALLKESDWYGAADWDNAAQMERLRSYFSGKR